MTSSDDTPLPDRPRIRRRTTGTVALLVVLTCATAWLLRTGHRGVLPAGIKNIAAFAALFALFLAAAWMVRTLPRRRAAILILLGGIALQTVAATTPPRTSDDLYRYVWDGRVQAAGIDPYRYVPAAPELVKLRDAELWPGTTNVWCVPAPATATTAGTPATPATVPGCTRINRPKVHTIYPPVAEAYFYAVDETIPGGARGIQAAAAFAAVAVTGLLLWGLRRLGRDPRTAALWAWCPTVAIEAGNNGHVDVIAVFLTGCALILLAGNQTIRGGVLLGLAVATKATPALAVPGALARKPFTLLAAVTAPIALVYLPHLLAVGSGALGFLGGYLHEEGYDDGTRFAVLSHVMPDSWVRPAAAAILVAVALGIWRWAARSDGTQPWRGALIMTGTAMLVAAPPFPWYAMLLVLFIALDGWRSAPWLSVALAGYVVAVSSQHGALWGYGGASIVLIISYGLAWRRDRTAAPRKALDTPAAHFRSAAPSALEGAQMSANPLPLVTVILPCLDEAEALPYVLGRIPAGYHAIVVDNGSTDASAAVAAALGAQVIHEPRRGFGAACHTGLLAATTEVVCFLDCDGSFDPRDLPSVVDPVLRGEADLLLGQRRPLTRSAWPPHARLANRLLARRINRTTGVRIHDLGPMRAANREALLALAITDRRFGYPLEMVLKAAQADWRIAEVPVPYAPRTGKSKVTGTVRGTAKAVRDMRRVWKAATR